MPRILRDLHITEVSSVDKGAGRGVKVLLMKRDGANPGDLAMTKEELDAAIKKAAEDAAATAVAAVSKGFSAELAKRDAEIVLLKMSDTHKSFMSGCDAETQKSFAAMDDKGRDDFMSKNPIKKREDPVVNADLAKRDETITKQAGQIDMLQKRLDASDLKDAQAEFKKRASDMGLTADGDGEVMRKAYLGDKDAQVAFEKRQVDTRKALAAQVDTSKLFGEFGTAKGAAGDAYGTMVAKAAELRKSDSKLTEAQAFSKVYEDPANADLVKQYKAEDIKRLQVVA